MLSKMEIPEGWKIISISNIGTVVTGKTPSTKIKEYFGGDIPFITPADINNISIHIEKTDRTLTNEGIVKANILPKNSIVVTCIGTLGKIGLTKIKSATNQQINSIIVNNEKYYFLYIFYCIQRIFPQVANSIVGKNVVPIINKTSFQSIKLPIPPLPEQHKIAAILSSVDNAIQATKKVIHKTQRLKKGLMQQLLTKGIGHTEFKEVKIGNYSYNIPKASKLIILKDVPINYNKNSLNASTDSDYVFNYYSISNIGNGYLINPPEQLIFKEAPSRAKRIVEPKNLVISSVRPNLRSKYFITKEIRFPAVFSTGFIVMSEKQEMKLSMKYLYHLFDHELLYSQIVRKAVGSNYPAITVKDIKSSYIILHSYKEQEKIVSILSSVDSEINSLKLNLEKYYKIKKGLMQQLLTGKIRVK